MGFCLKEVFKGNEVTCLKVTPSVIQKIVVMLADQREKAPSLLELLTALVKVFLNSFHLILYMYNITEMDLH